MQRPDEFANERVKRKLITYSATDETGSEEGR